MYVLGRILIVLFERIKDQLRARANNTHMEYVMNSVHI